MTELRSFLGYCNVFRRFVSNFADISAPLYNNVQKGNQRASTLTEDERSSMNKIHEHLITLPILALQRTKGNYTIETDVCDLQIGCGLLQEQSDRTSTPVDYWSSSVTKRRRITTRRIASA